MRGRSRTLREPGRVMELEGKRGKTYKVKIDLPSHDGKRHVFTRTFKTRDEAEADLARKRQEVKRGIRLNDTQTLSEWAREWLDIHIPGEIERRTWEGYDQKLRLHVLPTLGNKELRQLTVAEIEAMYRALARSGGRSGKGLDKVTITHIHRILCGCLKDAVRLGRLADNPAAVAKRGKKQAEKEQPAAKMKILEPAQLTRLLDGFRARGNSIKSAPYALVVLALDSGARRGELLALRWADCDLDKRTIRIERAIDETKANGIRIRAWPKNDSSIRTVTISASTAAVLREEWKRRAEDQLKLGQRPAAAALVFPLSPETPAEPLRPGEVTKAFMRAAKHLGLPIRLHDLRHNCASHMLKNGRTIPDVARHLGHASLDMVLRRYGHFVPDGSQRKGLLDEMGA